MSLGQSFEKKYRCVIQHRGAMLLCFHAENLQEAVARMMVFITDEYPRAHGKVFDKRGHVFFKCHQQAIC